MLNTTMPNTTTSTAPQLSFIVPYLLIFMVFYFIVIRPSKKQREQQEKQVADMKNNLKKNDQVITTSGIHGTVVLVKEKTVVLRVDDNVKIEFEKDALSSVVK